MATKRLHDDHPNSKYRGWLRNPATGREFRANHVTALRTDLERIEGPGAEPEVTQSNRQPVETQTPDEEVGTSTEAASDALSGLREKAENAQSVDELRPIAAQLDVDIHPATKKVETVRQNVIERIELLEG